MNKILSILIGLIITVPTFAATRDNQQHSRSMIGSASITKFDNKPSLKFQNDNLPSESVVVQPVTPTPTPEPDNREAERTACLSNNIGARNTFVWASKYSTTDNYASMVEDVENPENNICFARVELFSGDTHVNISDIAGRYFPMDSIVNCGEWADKSLLENRILNAKKSTRTWATIGGVIGGAGIGVSAMELFGNRIIGGAVMGQKNKNLTDKAFLIAQLKTMKEKDNNNYKNFVNYLKAIQKACNDDDTRSGKCDTVDYDGILYELKE